MEFARKVKKDVRVIGFELLVERERYEGNKKVTKFRREGFLFSGDGDARRYQQKHYYSYRYRIQRVRVDYTPLGLPPSTRGSARE